MAESVVLMVIDRLTDLLTEEATLLHGVLDRVEELVLQFKRIQTFLPDADSRIKEQNIIILLADVRELAYYAEHVVERFLLKASASQRHRNGVKRYTCIPDEHAYQRKFNEQVEDTQRKISDLLHRFSDYGIISTLQTPESSNSWYGTRGKLKRFYSHAVVEPPIFVAFHGDVEKLIGHLVNQSDDCYHLISICGMGGLGKTTLAQKIYNDSTIKTHFEGLAWVTISQQWQITDVLRRILISLNPHKERKQILALKDDELVKNILEIQQTKKCLIVVDDIWSKGAWDSLKAAFTTENSGSKLLLTTRDVAVAEYVDPKGYIHRPEFLNAEQSWELLRSKAVHRGLDTRDLKKMEELGREMLVNCGGLPLAIVILGGILVTKPSLTSWEMVYDDSKLSLKRGKRLGEVQQREIFDILIWSYNYLPPQLKACFVYLSKFKEDEEIETESLYQLWIAEDMVLSSDRREGETKMEVAESYLAELVHKSMVQVKFEEQEHAHSPLRKFKSCRLHDLMRDLALSKAEEEEFFRVVDIQERRDFQCDLSVELLSSCTKQLVVYFPKLRDTSIKTDHSVNGVHLRSIFLLREFEYDLPIYRIKIANFKLLRVFVLEGNDVRVGASKSLFRIGLDGVLSSLVYLRYLSVRTGSFICPSVQNLVLLQTLKLDNMWAVGDLRWTAAELRNVGRLQHLVLPSIFTLKTSAKRKLRFDGLSKLEIVENFDSSWCEVKDLPKLVNLRKLMVRVVNCKEDLIEVLKYLQGITSSSSYTCLRYLSLTITECHLSKGNDASEILRMLFCERQLRELVLNGSIPELVEFVDPSLCHITSLELFQSKVEQDIMPLLERIPVLRTLVLSSDSVLAQEMVCSAGGFPKLITLKLVHVCNLERWSLEEGSMPNLANLDIWGCDKLENIPEGLRFLKSLATVKIIYMPDAFSERVKSADFYKVAHVPSLIVRDVPDNPEELFKEIMDDNFFGRY